MAINKQKLLPSSGSSAAIIKSTIKTSAISKSIIKPSSAIIKNLEKSSSAIVKADDIKVNSEDLKSKDPSLSIYKKVIKIDKLLKNNFKLQSKTEESRKKESESKKKESREKELETPKKFKGFQILKNALPQTGIVDAVKRFIIFTFAGWAFTQLFQFLPKLLDIVKFITPIYSWFEKGIGMLFEGFISFIDFGYKAYDSVRGLTKQIGGENFQKTFDDFSSNLNKFLNLAITAAMIAASTGGFGKGGRGGKPPVGPRVTPRGKPRVTTSGGRPVGRPGVRSPIRQKPTVTTSGGKPVGKFQLPKGAKALTKGARGIIGIGTILDLGIRIASGQPVSKAVVGAAGGAIGAGIGTWLGGAIGGVAGSVVPVIGNLLLGGAGATIGGILGGMLGGGIADSLYDAVTGYGKKNDIQKKATGGLVQKKTKKPPTPQRRRTKIQSPIKKISKTKIQPGKDVGGRKKIEKLYPNPENKLFGIIPIPGEFSWLDFIFGGKKSEAQKNVKKGNIPNAFKALIDTGETLGKSGDWVGALMKAGIQVALGEVPDVKSIASAITQVINAAKSPAIQGIEAIRKEIQGFSDGGLVSANSMSSETNSLLLERALEGTIKKRVDDALNSVKREVRKRGPVGRDEMLEANRSKGAGGGGEGGGPSAGGELDISDITADTPEERAFIATIRQLEGTAGKQGYNTFFGGSQYGGDLSKKTVSEVKVLQEKFLAEGKGKFSGGKSAAVGAGQFLYPEEIVKAMGLDPNKEKFTPELQNKMILYLAKKKRGIDVTKPLTESDMAVLGKEWASLTPYHGQTGRTGKESLSVYNKFLQNARQNTKELKTKVQGGSKPSGFMTSAYGMRLHPVTGGYKMHQGMDFAGGDFSAGKPISIIKPGKVVDINTDGQGGGYGNFVVVKHDDGTYSFYAHLNEVKVKKGDKLSMESGKYAPVIGTVGSTGVGTGAHLHVEIGTGWNGGVLTGRKDPKDVVDQYLRGGGNVKVEETKVTDEKKQKEISIAKQKGLNLGYYYKNGKYYQKGGGLFGTDKEIEVTDTKNTWLRTLIPPTTQPTTKSITTQKSKPSSIFTKPSSTSSSSTPSNIFDWNKMQGGGFISPSKSNVPNVSSRAYYETPVSSTLMAILPIEITQTVPVPFGGGAIFDSFPIAGLNNNKNSYGLMRG